MTPNDDPCATSTALDQQQRDDHHAAGGHQHQERHQTMLPEAAVPLDAPRFVHGARDRPEHSERRPDQRQPAGHAKLHAALSLNACSCLLTKSSLVGKYRKTNVRTASRSFSLSVIDPSMREDQQQEGKEREEGVVRDGRGVRHVVAVDQLDDAAPGGDARQPKLRPQAPYDALRRHALGLLQTDVVVRRSAATAPWLRLKVGHYEKPYDCPKLPLEPVAASCRRPELAASCCRALL